MIGLFRYCAPFLFLAATVAAAAMGRLWPVLAIALIPAALLSLDAVLGADAGASDAAEPALSAPSHGLGFRALPIAFALCQILASGWAALSSARAADALSAICLSLSVGVCAGVFGVLAAHDLVHSPRRTDRAIGLLMLATMGYMHFRIAHIHGHHRRAATPEDPASARLGEPVYAFILRSVVGQWSEAWRFERHRLRRRAPLGRWLRNRMAHYLLVQTALGVGVFLVEPRALLALVGQAAVAVAMLELFNYVAHYGLQREACGSGYRRLEPRHCWGSRRRMNNGALFNMGRHSDHHRRPTASYQSLVAGATDAELPSGYAGAILLALIPPLWSRVMDPRVAALASSAGVER